MLVEYTRSDEQICDCNCPNTDCVHNKINQRKDVNYERNDHYYQRKLSGTHGGN